MKPLGFGLEKRILGIMCTRLCTQGRKISQTQSEIITYLSWTRSCSRSRRCRTHRSCGRAVRAWQTVVMLRILVPPFWTRIHLWWGMTLILSHVVALRVVRRIRRRVSWAGCGYRRIYRNVRVRLNVRWIAMVRLLPILQGH